jgi:hypothetical protein
MGGKWHTRAGRGFQILHLIRNDTGADVPSQHARYGGSGRCDMVRDTVIESVTDRLSRPFQSLLCALPNLRR